MRKYLSFLPVLLLLAAHSLHAQLKSPEEFLGYKIGTRYTPHWRGVNYFQHVGKQNPSPAKLHQHGKTKEGRPRLPGVYFIRRKYEQPGEYPD